MLGRSTGDMRLCGCIYSLSNGSAAPVHSLELHQDMEGFAGSHTWSDTLLDFRVNHGSGVGSGALLVNNYISYNQVHIFISAARRNCCSINITTI